MRVLETSPHRLTLEDRPWLLGIILVGVIVFLMFLALVTVRESGWIALAMTLMAALFAGAFVIFVRRVIVIFDLMAGAVVVRTKSLLGQSETTHPLAKVTRASVQTSISRSSSSNGGRGRTHRPVLHLGEEIIPLTLIYTGGNGADRAAAAINDWLSQ